MNDMVRTPAHLWIVGVLAVLWNGYGCYDYLMTQTRNADYFAMIGFTDAQRAFVESFPPWMDGAWGIGVWGGLLGALLLLARSRWAVVAFGLSLLGLAAGTTYQYVLSSPPAEMSTPGMIAMNVAIWAVCIGLFVYAREMRRKGILR